MDFGTLPLSIIRRVDQACDRFEAEWQAGRRPEIERYLETASEPERLALLQALLVTELELRQDLGERPTADEYLRRFPRFAGIVDFAFAGHATALDNPDVTDSGPAWTIDHPIPTAPDPAWTIDHPTPAGSGPPEETSWGRTTPEGQRFLVLKLHARGGLGEVYVAHDLELNREVALKAIQDRHAGDPYCRWRFPAGG